MLMRNVSCNTTIESQVCETHSNDGRVYWVSVALRDCLLDILSGLFKVMQ